LETRIRGGLAVIQEMSLNLMGLMTEKWQAIGNPIMLSEAMLSIEMLDLALLWDVSVLTSNLRETGDFL
jgi:hypothetical protein